MDIQNRLDALHQKKFNHQLALERAKRTVDRLEGQISEIDLILENLELAKKSHLLTRNLKESKKKNGAKEVFSEETHEMPIEKSSEKPRNFLKKKASDFLFGDDEGGSDE